MKVLLQNYGDKSNMHRTQRYSQVKMKRCYYSEHTKKQQNMSE